MTADVFASKTRFFDRWALSYDWLLPSVFYQAIHQRLLEYVELSAQAQILDIGCGTGRLLNRLAAQYPESRGIGLDLSSEMVRQARRRSRHRTQLIFVQGRSDAIPFADEQFEAAFSTISFLHYPDPHKVFTEVNRVLQPQGRFYLVDYTTTKLQSQPQQLSVSPGGIRFYSPNTREHFGAEVGLSCLEHVYLLGPVLLTIFVKEQNND